VSHRCAHSTSITENDRRLSSGTHVAHQCCPPTEPDQSDLGGRQCVGHRRKSLRPTRQCHSVLTLFRAQSAAAAVDRLDPRLAEAAKDVGRAVHRIPVAALIAVTIIAEIEEFCTKVSAVVPLVITVRYK
jgi:hypothetical protein